MFIYWLFKIILTPLLYLMFRTKVQGRENIPKRGGAILAANHVSFLENFMIPAVTRFRKVTYVAKAEYFESWKTRWFYAGAGQIPMSRTGGDAGDAALIAAEGAIAAGDLFGIYPEGTRSPDGRLYRGKTGVARVALRTGAPLIPVGVIGTDKAMGPDAKIPRPHKVIVKFGSPIDVEKYRLWPDQRAAARALTDEVMFRIRDLTGQEYVDEYSKRARQRSRRRSGDIDAGDEEARAA